MTENEATTTQARTTTKRDADAPRGVFRRALRTWAIRFICGQGHTHEETIGALKGDAVRAHQARRARVLAEPAWCPREERRQVRAAYTCQENPVTVRAYGDRWLREHVAVLCKPRTRELYGSVFARHVYPALGDLALAEVTRERIRTLLADKAAEGLARATLTNVLIPLRAMLACAVDDGRLVVNPAARLGRFSRGLTPTEARTVTALTADELARVLAVADKYFPESSDLLRVLAWCGVRLGEACALRWEDLDVAGRFLEIRRTVSVRGRRVLVGAPKSGQARRVDVPAVLVARLRERMTLREAEAAVAGHELSPWIFPAPSDNTRPMNAAFLRFKVWYRLLRLAGLRGVRLHDVRHTYASLLLQAGEPIGYVKAQLGHSSIQVTVDRYGHFIPGANRAAVDRLADATERAGAVLHLDSTWTSGERVEAASAERRASTRQGMVPPG